MHLAVDHTGVSLVLIQQLSDLRPSTGFHDLPKVETKKKTKQLGLKQDLGANITSQSLKK